MNLKHSLAFLSLAGLAVGPAKAAVMYTTPGSTYSQNFDTLPNAPTNTNLQLVSGSNPGPVKKWIDDSATPPGSDFSIVGWYLYHPQTQASEGGTNEHQRVRLGDGSAIPGRFGASARDSGQTRQTTRRSAPLEC